VTSYVRQPHPKGQFGLSSVYTEYYWLPTLGPTSWALLRTLDRNFIRTRQPRLEVSDEVLARTIGVMPNTLARCLSRCVTFGTLERGAEHVIVVPELLPPISHGMLRRLTDQLIEHHPYFLQESDHAA
jgi:hypothetical protein